MPQTASDTPLKNWLLNFHEAELKPRLMEAQTRSSEQVIALMDLVAANGDTSEAEKALMDTMNDLIRLREVERAFVEMRLLLA